MDHKPSAELRENFGGHPRSPGRGLCPLLPVPRTGCPHSRGTLLIPH